MWDVWKTLSMDIVDKHAPLKTKRDLNNGEALPSQNTQKKKTF